MRTGIAAAAALLMFLGGSRIHAQTRDVTTTPLAQSIASEAIALASQSPVTVDDREWQVQYDRAVGHRSLGKKEVGFGIVVAFAGAWLTWTDHKRPPAWPFVTFSGAALTTFGAIEWFRARADLKTLRLQREHERP